MGASKDQIQTSIDRTAHLVFVGASLLMAMLSDDDANGPVSFQDWADSVRSSPELGSEATTDNHLHWLWDMLRTAPDLKETFAMATAARRQRGEQIDVFHPGDWFVIGMKRGDVAQMLQRRGGLPQEERVSVRIQEQLRMRPGRGDRFECCDCKAEVVIRIPDIFPVAREADIMRVEVDRIELGEGFVTVQVDSLNQAYTVASRRLEPERRSHGGRIYDHVVHVRGNERTRLEVIRQQVECGSWQTPQAVGGDSTGDLPNSAGKEGGERTLFD